MNDGKLEAPEFPIYQLGSELDGQTLKVSRLGWPSYRLRTRTKTQCRLGR